jgi:site-specific recombinase XerD
MQVLWPIVALRLRRLGVELPHHGPHALRHACATHLLAEGLSLKEIGDHLGHSDPDATRIYAKVDIAGLRQVANMDLGGLL